MMLSNRAGDGAVESMLAIFRQGATGRQGAVVDRLGATRAH
jgi:hypothetical protein